MINERIIIVLLTSMFASATDVNASFPNGKVMLLPVEYLHIQLKLEHTGASTTMPQPRTRQICRTNVMNPVVVSMSCKDESTMSNVKVSNFRQCCRIACEGHRTKSKSFQLESDANLLAFI